jgi:hypothetical protein
MLLGCADDQDLEAVALSYSAGASVYGNGLLLPWAWT